VNNELGSLFKEAIVPYLDAALLTTSDHFFLGLFGEENSIEIAIKMLRTLQSFF
jgi:hypothetical protein